MNRHLVRMLVLALGSAISVAKGTTSAAGAHDEGLKKTSSAEPSTPVTVEQLYSVPRPADVEWSPDGRRILLTLQKPSANGMLRGESSLWLIDVTTGTLQQVATANRAGQRRASTTFLMRPRARWSHDGKRVLWIDSDGKHDQLWSYTLATSQVRQITTGNASIVDYAETPDGNAIALVEIAKSIRRADALLHAEAYFFSDYPEGWWTPSITDPVNVDLLDLRSGALAKIASDLPGAIELSWDARGNRLLFVPRIESWGGMIVAPLIYSRTTGKLTTAVEPASTLQQPTWIENGRSLAWLEHVLYSAASRTPRKGVQFTGGLFSNLPILKTGELRQDRVVHSRVLLDEHALIRPGIPVIWNAHDHALFLGLSKQARDSVYVVDMSTGTRRRITPMQFHVLNYDISENGKQWAAILTNANTPPEVYIGDINGGEVRKLTDFADKLTFEPGKVLPVHWRSGDGRFDVHGWLVTPPNYDPSKRYPMVVDCHGGPSGTIRDDFWTIQTDNVPPAILASHGYLVLLPNPRGDPGYSVEYTKALVGHFMTGDVGQDILPGVDAMVAAGIADPNRLAITGLSAGATRVAWAIAHTTRFKAASLSDGPVDFLSYWGQALPWNTGWIDFYLEGTPNTRMSDYIKRSPITYAYRIQTPTLMRFANRNAKLWDVPMTPQGKELQAMLYMKRVPTDIQIEPFALHAPRTIGALQLWTDANLAWFDHYVMGKPYVRPSPCGAREAQAHKLDAEPCVLAAPK